MQGEGKVIECPNFGRRLLDVRLDLVGEAETWCHKCQCPVLFVLRKGVTLIKEVLKKGA